MLSIAICQDFTVVNCAKWGILHTSYADFAIYCVLSSVEIWHIIEIIMTEVVNTMASNEKYEAAAWIFFVLYMLLLIKLTVIRNDFLLWAPFSHGVLNLVPLRNYIKLFHRHLYGYSFYMFFGNIGMFMPFGYLLPYLLGRPRKLLPMALLGFLLTLFIEVSQYAFGTGETEIDDILLNTLGVALGFLLLKVYIRWRGKRRENGMKTDASTYGDLQ